MNHIKCLSIFRNSGITLGYLFLILALNGCANRTSNKKVKPNIVIIYADDLGYGDVSCYGATELQTPNIDKLADEGIRFTQGYSTSATCTPSRYGMLTGQYPWKNTRAQVLPGDAPLLIEPGSVTLPSMLKEAGYTTGIVGKWHLGLGKGNVNWNEEVKPGPREVGFDYDFIMAATNDRVPTVFLESGHVVGLDKTDPIEVSYRKNFEGQPTVDENPELLRMKSSQGHNNSIVNGIGRIGFMKGGESAKWIDENMADTFLVRAQKFVELNNDKPFFLYYALNQPHVPRVPHPRFAGKSGLGPRGDVILEADWCIGEFMKTLEKNGLAENTIVIFSSDNGPVGDDGYYDDAEVLMGDHKPAGPLRSGKYSLYDGGTRVPFILRWKGRVKPGVSDAMVCQMDFLASFASLLGIQTKTNDSENILPALLGESKMGRDDLVVQGMKATAYRNGDWSLILPHNGPKMVPWGVKNETGFTADVQLYNLASDLGQKVNVAEQEPELVEQLSNKYNAITQNLEVKPVQSLKDF
ncbi:arylsulfatase [Prolixibacteraceae bacterium Z1-6]|uniref:Arylsulfatase n=1 Tax=Draconibacterium aestuarii TaxID=2998507 RepID=A0A9X3FB89_9BACT|nr:arylsulfatase [Prolixibacteraceae bacterium Z1-6]